MNSLNEDFLHFIETTELLRSWILRLFVLFVSFFFSRFFSVLFSSAAVLLYRYHFSHFGNSGKAYHYTVAFVDLLITQSYNAHSSVGA